MMISRLSKIAGALLALGLSAVAIMNVISVEPKPAKAQLLSRDKIVPESKEALQFSFAPIVKKVTPAVVNVYVRSRVQAFNSPFANDPIFRRLFGDRFGQPSERVQSSLGSGVIISADGVVVTNTHVVKGRGDTEIRVALSDKREFDARVLSQDEKTDIAVLKIESRDDDFPFLEFEDSDSLEVGDLVLAIGNPFGVGQTVTSGIVSALARTEIGMSDAQVFIQTDAAINPGNSGGALVDLAGKLVGINTMIYSNSGGSVGIGFAIPSNLVKLYTESAVAGRKVERPWLGAKLETLNREIAEGLGIDRVAGAVVTRLSNNGPANEAGLQPGDVITKVDGFDTADARSVYYRLTTKGVGASSRLEVIRKGRTETIDVALKPAPQLGADDVRNLTGPHPFDGARVANIHPAIADEFGIEDEEGAVIINIKRGSISARMGFQPGDVIVQIGREKIANLRDLESAIAERQRVWQFAVRRNGRLLRFEIPG